MKHILSAPLAACLLLTTVAATAQPMLHINTGGLHSNWRGDGLNILQSISSVTQTNLLTQQGYNSMYFGVSMEWPLGEHFSIEPGLQYSRTGASLQGNLAVKALSLLGISAGVKAVSDRLEMPVLAKAEVVKGLYVVAGPQANYAFDNTLKMHGSVMGINLINKKLDMNDAIEPFSASAVGGLQYQFNGGFQLQALYEYGLTRIAKNNSADIYQNSFRVGMGIPISL